MTVAESRKDPPTSEAQRRAMGAAMSGNSNLDIPKSVGKEFIEADPGGKLPARARDRHRADQVAAIQDGLSSLVRRMDALEKACGDDCRDDEGGTG